MWRCLRHPNVVPFIGTSEHFPVSLVSEWMSGGTMTAFLREHPNRERSSLVSRRKPNAGSVAEPCSSKVIDILQGLGFIHSLDVVHGDLKPVCTRHDPLLPRSLMYRKDNVLIDVQGRARLTDFGLAITLNATVASATVNGLGTPCYMAPELWGDEKPAKASDVYALAMTVWHVSVPYVINHPPCSRDVRSTAE
jgi:serine/threonine protein kinase